MNKKKSGKALEEMMELHRRRLARLSERRGVASLKKLYDGAQSELAMKIKKVGRSSAPFTAHHKNVVMAQVKHGQTLMAQQMAGGLADATREAQVDSLRGLVGDLTKMEKIFTGSEIALPIDEASRFRGIVDGRRESMLRSHADSLANYGSRIVTKIEDQLSLSLLEEESYGEAVDRVVDATGGEWWQGERIVRSEIMGSFNGVQYDGIKEAAGVLDDLMMRWVEYVDDDTYEPLDDRVGEDSIAMHSQVAKAGGLFHFPHSMPTGEALPPECESFIGETYAFPPNRPNDRASLSPFRPHWGIPGWVWSVGRRVQI